MLENYEVITKDDIRSNEELKNHLIDKFKKWFMHSETFVSTKRKLFHERWDKMTNPQTYNTDYIKIYTALDQKRAFRATFHDSAFGVKFTWQEFSDDDKAYKLTKLAEYDYWVMDRYLKDIAKLDHLFTYWVCIEIPTGYDKVKKVTTYTVMNPELWYPDPLRNVLTEKFRYHFFKTWASQDDLEAVNKSNPDTYFNLESLAWRSSSQTNDWTDSKISSRNLSKPAVEEGRYDIFDWYANLWGRWYMFSLNHDRSEFIRWEVIEPVGQEEKKNPHLMPDPVNITWIAPLENDVFGWSPLWGIIDKQNAQNVLMNLAIIKEQQNVFQKYLVDTEMVSNMDHFSLPTDKNHVYIPASSKNARNKSIQQAVSTVGDMKATDVNKLNLSDKIDLIVQAQTWFTDQNRWVASQWDTLGESSMLQENSNLLFSLDATLIAKGEEWFWKNIWYRGIKKYFRQSEEKFFRIGSWISGKTIRFTRDDLLSGDNPDIRVVSKKREDAKNREKLIHMEQLYPMIMQNPNIPEISKKLFEREMYELKGMSREKALLMSPISPDERRALAYREMLNNEIEFNNLFTPGMDLYTYWVILNGAEESDQKDRVIQVLEQMMIEQWLNVPQNPMWNFQQMANSVANQKTAQLINQQNSQVPTFNPAWSNV